jgi:hypothetical protein
LQNDAGFRGAALAKIGPAHAAAASARFAAAPMRGGDRRISQHCPDAGLRDRVMTAGVLLGWPADLPPSETEAGIGSAPAVAAAVLDDQLSPISQVTGHPACAFCPQVASRSHSAVLQSYCL